MNIPSSHSGFAVSDMTRPYAAASLAAGWPRRV